MRHNCYKALVMKEKNREFCKNNVLKGLFYRIEVATEKTIERNVLNERKHVYIYSLSKDNYLLLENVYLQYILCQ